MLEPAEADLIEQLVGADAVPAGDAATVASVDRQQDVLAGGSPVEEDGALEHHADLGGD